MQLGYRTGTITGMLTDGLGLLGGTCIFLMYGEQAYEALLGFGFGGTLLALFMRVGGGIYTKAADVGADLVGKVEAGIPEDDPRNAATIADNVGDNVGDCAGMAADIFESYEVTIVAAMILGLASFGHKGVIFPLLVRGIGVLGSIISTYTVKAGPNDTSDTALKSVHRGFWIGSMISVAGFFLLGLLYLHFPPAYLTQYPMAAAGFPDGIAANLPFWANFFIPDLDMRPAWTCLIGVFLAIALNKVTSYYTHTSHTPVKTLARACQTGHATNIIQGFAVGYESTVAAVLVIAVAIILSVLCYAGTPPVFVAYGVAMTGIGMLTLTGNTISMDVFGPVADNANGIGEMGYDREEMDRDQPGSYKRARQILADLDAVGNTTKAETKGIAIGSAVIAAVSLFASFIAVIAVGSEDKSERDDADPVRHVCRQVDRGRSAGADRLPDRRRRAVPVQLDADPCGRSGGVLHCQGSPHPVPGPGHHGGDQEAGLRPRGGHLHQQCPARADRPGAAGDSGSGLRRLPARPVRAGRFPGRHDSGRPVVGRVHGQRRRRLGQCQEDDRGRRSYGGKGSEAHKASVTGDTVGDPLKDTAGPAINPLVKVMNMVSLLGLGLVLSYNVMGINSTPNVAVPLFNRFVGLLVTLLAVAGIAWAVWRSKHESAEMKEIVGGLDDV